MLIHAALNDRDDVRFTPEITIGERDARRAVLHHDRPPSLIAIIL